MNSDHYVSATPPGRLVLFIQRLISFLFPPLHSLHWKIFLLCLIAIFIPGIYFAWEIGQNIERSHLRSTEQGMIDTALVVAELSSLKSLENFDGAREILRTVFNDLSPNLRVILYNPEGGVIHDTEGELRPGMNASSQRDVRKAMKGNYGARWERDNYRRVVVLYSTLPVIKDGTITGLVSVSKTSADVRKSVIRSLKDLAIPALLAFGLASLVSYFLSSYLTRIIRGLARRAELVAAGEPNVRLETWTKSELGDLARALEKMRQKLEGKAYVQEMAVTLSHEIKTPLASIRGSAEILEHAKDDAVRKKFLGNIMAEVDRLTSIVSNLLELSRIESAPLITSTRSSLAEVAKQTAAHFHERAEMLGLVFEEKISPSSLSPQIPPDQLKRLIMALLENAFQFTPTGCKVTLEVEGSRLCVRDEGLGISEEVKGKIFDRFFTTTNPLTGRRGTGLGLAIVKSLATRYHAQITLESRPEMGTSISIDFSEIS